jgi:hypothetical protein
MLMRESKKEEVRIKKDERKGKERHATDQGATKMES